MNGAYSANGSQERTFRCIMTIPRAGLQESPAVATSFDRWGAILHVDAEPISSAVIDVDDPVELDLSLPGHPAIGKRAMHCSGKVIQTSKDLNGQLWLVVRFHQLQIRPVMEEDAIDTVLPPVQATDRSNRSLGVAE